MDSITLENYLKERPFTGLTQEWVTHLWKTLQLTAIEVLPIKEHRPDGTRREKYDPDTWEYSEWCDHSDFPYWAKVDSCNPSCRHIIEDADDLPQMVLAVLILFKLEKAHSAAIFKRGESDRPITYFTWAENEPRLTSERTC